MIEGIIQEVLADFFYDCHTRRELEKKLIERIRKSLAARECENCKCEKCQEVLALLETLVGDGKE